MASWPVAWPSPSSPAVASVRIGGVLALGYPGPFLEEPVAGSFMCRPDVLHDDDDLPSRLSVTLYWMVRPSEGI